MLGPESFSRVRSRGINTQIASRIPFIDEESQVNFEKTKRALSFPCNLIVSGGFLEPAAYPVEFEFGRFRKPLYITLTAIGLGIVLCGILVAAGQRRQTEMAS
jgi:hypothetical protein